MLTLANVPPPSTDEAERAAQALERAVEALKARGWTRTRASHHVARLDLVGAVRVGFGHSPLSDRAHESLQDRAYLVAWACITKTLVEEWGCEPASGVSIVGTRWAAERLRTVDEVIAMLGLARLRLMCHASRGAAVRGA